jgi:hypothetical protein
VDAFEVFNARYLKNKPNKKAAAFVREHGLLATVGSDAHTLIEVGQATLRMPSFTDPASFIAALQNAQSYTRLSPAIVHLFTRFAVLYKRFQR